MAAMPSQAAVDPWVIQPRERERYEEQFKSLKPVNGIIRGDQAKGFLLQSQLPPQILGVIWGLADTDADGKMNINEFSIACKLINLKLRGFELPKTLPPSLLQIVKSPPAAAPAAPVTGNLIQNGAPPIPPFPSAASLQRVSAVPTMPVAPIMSAPITNQPVSAAPAMAAPAMAAPAMAAPAMAAPAMGAPLVPGVGGSAPLIPQVPSTMAPGIPPAIPRMPMMTSAGVAIPPVASMPPAMMAGVPGIPPATGMPSVPATVGGMVPGQQIPVSGGMPLGGVPMTGLPGVPGAPAMPMGVVAPAPGMAIVPGVPAVPGATAVPRLPGVVPLPLTQATPGPPSLAGTPNSVGSGSGPEVPGASAGRLGSVDLTFGSPVQEWAVPHQSKLKYTQMFNTTDRARSGFMSGLQARSIMMATGLPHPILAQIWGLADMDSDGRLSSDEFVLAMHLCDMGKAGEKIPAVLPPELVPPAFRRQQTNTSVVTSPAGQALDKQIDQDAAATLMNNVTFEDKRKENFEKGQAELERRRKSLLEVQRKEQEERERKEREEQEKREKIRLEQERRRQEEMEKQLQRQRELEQEREQQLRYQQEQREAARRELERQRQLEWEKQRSQELQQARQREQEKVLRLKSQNQSLGIELSQLNEKVKELTTKISETRLGVANVKTTIDGMRGTRDTQMAEMTSLKAKLKEQNNRLLSVTAEKARLEQKNKRNQESADPNKESMAEATANKQIALKQLKDRLADLETEIAAKVEDMKNNNTQLGDLKSELSTLVNDCDKLWSTYEERRLKVKQMKTRLRSDPNEAWGDTAWNAAPDASSSWPEDGDVVIPSTGKKALLRYRALYEFVARSGDEISFQPGDIILVPVQQNAEPGWLAGEIRGHTGWFPESYVEPIDVPKPAMGEAVDLPGEKVSPVSAARALEGIAEVPENIVDPTAAADLSALPVAAAEPVDPAAATTGQLPPEEQEYYTALYPYQSTEVGDLCFQQGEVILVVKKDGDWWTGITGDRTGIFPSNYVQKAEDQPSAVVPAETVLPATEPPTEPVAEEPAVKETSPPVQTEVQPVVQEKPATPDFAVLNSSTPLEEDPDGKGSKSKKPEIATVMAPYTATSPEQLNLSRGQLIMIRKKSNTGWWEGELQAKGQKRQVGWFPASYVKLLGGQGARKSSDVSASNTPPPSSASPVPSATGSEPNLEKVVALYQYTAQNEDELSFEKDDIITLLAKEEAAWWRGELNGVSGLFPSNYVAPVSVEMLRGTERKRQDSIDELIYTEQAYIDDMSVVHDVFEKPLLQQQILTPELTQKIFVNWEEIIVCNFMFLRALRVRREMSSGGIIRMIGDILCENLPRMNVYVRFCSCQLNAAATLQRLTEDNSEFREVTRQCQNDPRTKGMPLSSFLIKPMQRITKYPLLIKKILQYTPQDHPDYTYLQEALAKAEEFCTQVNEGVREKENSDRLEWLQQHVIFEGLEEKITFNSLTNCLGSRKFLHYGVLMKAKSGKELVAFLMNDFFLLTRPSKTLGSNRQFSFERCSNIFLKLYKEPIILNEMRMLDESSTINGKVSPIDGRLVSGDTTALRIEHIKSKTVFSFLAPSVNERNLWYKKLDAAQKNFLENERSYFQRQKSKQAQFGAVGRILAVVMSGSNFPPVSSGGKSEIFCKVNMGSQGERTPVASGPNPQWHASMQFLVKDLQEDSLCITVFERGQFKPDEFLGRTEIRIQDINQASGRVPGPINKVLKLHEVDSGEVEVKLDLRLFHR